MMMVLGRSYSSFRYYIWTTCAYMLHQNAPFRCAIFLRWCFLSPIETSLTTADISEIPSRNLGWARIKAHTYSQPISNTHNIHKWNTVIHLAHSVKDTQIIFDDQTSDEERSASRACVAIHKELTLFWPTRDKAKMGRRGACFATPPDISHSCMMVKPTTANHHIAGSQICV